MKDEQDYETRPEITEEILRKKKMVWLVTAAMLVAFCVGTPLLLFLIWILFKGNTPAF